MHCTTKIDSCFFLSHPDCNRWFRSFTESAPDVFGEFADFTASRDFHPALRNDADCQIFRTPLFSYIDNYTYKNLKVKRKQKIKLLPAISQVSVR